MERWNIVKRWLAMVMVLVLVLSAAPVWAENSDSPNGSSRDNSTDSSSEIDNAADDSSTVADNPADDASGNHSTDSSRNESSNNGSDHMTGMDDAMNRTSTSDSVTHSSENSGDREHMLVSNVTAFEDEIHALEQEYTQAMAGSPGEIRDILAHQSGVQVGVDSFLLVKSQMGSSGPDISALAQQFNASFTSTAQAEEQIRKRDSITRLFMGGDRTATRIIDTEVSGNQVRILQLNQMLDQCINCTPGVKAVLQQQIQTMEQEQARLSGIAQKEHSDTGLFGWLFP